MGSVNERRCYYLMPFLIGWTDKQNDICYNSRCVMPNLLKALQMFGDEFHYPPW